MPLKENHARASQYTLAIFLNIRIPHTLTLTFWYVAAIAEVYKNEGNEEYGKKDFNNAIYFYTEGIKVNCKDEELKSKLYCNRAIAHFDLGKKY